jgi:hypothetical protein
MNHLNDTLVKGATGLAGLAGGEGVDALIQTTSNPVNDVVEAASRLIITGLTLWAMFRKPGQKKRA